MFPLPRTNLAVYRQSVADNDAEDWERFATYLFSLQRPEPSDEIDVALRSVEANMIRLLRDVDLVYTTPTGALVAAQVKYWRAPAAITRSRLPIGQLAVLVLVWLVLVGGPVAELKLPPEIQMMLGTEVGTVALALAITQMMKDKRK